MCLGHLQAAAGRLCFGLRGLPVEREGKAKISIFLSLSRQMLFLLPLLVILPPIMKVDGVWTAMPISDAVAAIVAFVMMAKYMKKFKKQMSVNKQTC